MKLMITDRHGNTLEQVPKLDEDMYVLGLDGSTSRSGVCVMTVGGTLGFVCAVERGTETVVEYKLGLKRFLAETIARYKVRYAAYEEPFIGYAGDVKGLYAIASTLEEILVESETKFQLTAVNNKRWKRQFLGRKLEGGSEVQKKNVRARAFEVVPALKVLEKYKDDYDETDAFGLTFYLARCVRENTVASMASQSKPRKFGYDAVICGGRVTAEEAVRTVGKALKDGVIIEDITTRRSFSAAVYSLMNGKNAILVLYFKSGKFGDIMLEYDAGGLAADNEMLTAIVTRKSATRKAKKKG